MSSGSWATACSQLSTTLSQTRGRLPPPRHLLWQVNGQGKFAHVQGCWLLHDSWVSTRAIQWSTGSKQKSIMDWPLLHDMLFGSTDRVRFAPRSNHPYLYTLCVEYTIYWNIVVVANLHNLLKNHSCSKLSYWGHLMLSVIITHSWSWKLCYWSWSI